MIKAFCICGGDKRDRTADLLNAIQALSQLSYTPILWRRSVGHVSLPFATVKILLSSVQHV